jgi:hypothetical protein
MAEINEKSDIEVTLLPPKRLRRKVVAVQFEVKEREADHARHDVSERLKKFGLGQRDINMALEMHSDEKLTAILDEIEHRMETQKINNPRAYTATVLRQFDGDVVPEVQQERESRRRSRDAESRSRALALENRRQQEREFARFQADRVAEEERTLTEAAAIRLKEAFVEHLKSEMPFVFEIYCTGGEDKPLVRHQLHQFKVKNAALSGGSELRPVDESTESVTRWQHAVAKPTLPCRFVSWLSYPVSGEQEAVTKFKVGRNDPCPCGSGRKYKRCCLGGHEPSQPRTAVQPHLCVHQA